MKKILIAAIAALAIPASALAADNSAPTAKQAAKASCHQQRDQMGKSTFHQTYGNNGLGKCISAAVKSQKAAIAQAKSDCQTATTSAKGTRNAYGKCVSAKVKAVAKHDADTKVAAAKTCKQMRKDNPADFTKKNAFGKCVSAQAKAKNDTTS